MTIQEHIPPYLLDDLKHPNTVLRIAPNWKIQKSSNRLWLYNEAKGSIDFDINEITAKIIIMISMETSTVKDIENIAANVQMKILKHLWTEDIIRIAPCNQKTDENSSKHSSTSRYIWLEEYLSRYASRSLSVPQMRTALSSSKICIIGLGGLGSTLALSLAASGVGSLKLIDGDIIEESNLPRQVIYSEKSIGKKKAIALKNSILSNNSAIKIEINENYISSDEDAAKAIEGCSFAVLCADQPKLKIRNWIGKACFENKIPHLFMAGQWVGPLSIPDVSPCYACIGRFHGLKISDAAGYIKNLASEDFPLRPSFGPRPLILAGFMSAVILHFLTGIDRESLLHRRFKFDLFGQMENENLVRYKNCLICGSA